MTVVTPTRGPARVPGVRRRAVRLLRRSARIDSRVAGILLLGSALIVALVFAAPDQMPFTSLALPLVLGGTLLGPRTVPWFVLAWTGLLTVAVTQQEIISSKTLGAVAVQVGLALIVLLTGWRRARLGVAGLRGESMFVDLRDRILNQAGIPRLPDDWVVESALHSAGGTAFAGDFFVTSLSPDRTALQVVVVDVSGKGEDAGTRALLLSGALGGLLGALPPERFLPAANEYLLAQGWEEGFATAIHLWLDLGTGEFEVRTAGHPPAAHRVAASGRWSVLRSDGPVLGLLDDVTFTPVRGRLGRGDAALLYTDGMVEEPRRDIDLGIDRMLGEAERLLRGSFVGGAERLASRLGSPHDDRAMLIVHRR